MRLLPSFLAADVSLEGLCNMSKKAARPASKTDWARVSAQTDAEIDTSEFPPLDETFFAGARLRLPKNLIPTAGPQPSQRSSAQSSPASRQARSQNRGERK